MLDGGRAPPEGMRADALYVNRLGLRAKDEPLRHGSDGPGP